MSDVVAYSGGRYVNIAAGSSGGGLPAIGSGYYVLRVNAGGTAAEWALITNDSISASAAIAVSKLAAGSAGTVLCGGSPNAFSATPTVTRIAAGAAIDANVAGLFKSTTSDTTTYPLVLNNASDISLLYVRSDGMLVFGGSATRIGTWNAFYTEDTHATLRNGRGDTYIQSNSTGSVLYLDACQAGGRIRLRTTGSETVGLDLGGTSADFIAFGAAPPSGGAVRISNGDYIEWNSDPAGTRIQAIAVSASENLILGTAGANGVVNVLYDCKTGGVHQLRVNGAPFASLGAAAGDYLAFGADPADTGALRLSHAMGVYGESNTPGTDRAIATWGVVANDTAAFGDANVAIQVVGSDVRAYVGATEKMKLAAASDDHITLGDNAVKHYESGGEAWCDANGISHQLTP